jgi:hypothetical protein
MVYPRSYRSKRQDFNNTVFKERKHFKDRNPALITRGRLRRRFYAQMWASIGEFQVAQSGVIQWVAGNWTVSAG